MDSSSPHRSRLQRTTSLSVCRIMLLVNGINFPSCCRISSWQSSLLSTRTVLIYGGEKLARFAEQPWQGTASRCSQQLWGP